MYIYYIKKNCLSKSVNNTVEFLTSFNFNKPKILAHSLHTVHAILCMTLCVYVPTQSWLVSLSVAPRVTDRNDVNEQVL